ncbi:MAG TPA: SpvB/TcaC N-terminal domain-containing protein, partial [Micromonosporaceae bacterium]|nr:SpvB/TcaC N-terminal domain-containing protein [Micromonosporaceae bacterium]
MPRPSEFVPMVPAEPADVVWPSAGSVTVDGSGTARPGGLPVSLRAAWDSSDVLVPGKPVGGGFVAGPSSVRVQVAERAAAASAGVAGVLFSLSRADGVATAGRVGFEVDYSSFARAYGGDFGGRLRLVRLPECAWWTPALAQCRVGSPVPGSRNLAGRRVVTVDSAAVDGVYGLTSGPASAAGDYRATSLAPSYQWSAGGQSGDFSTSYPVPVPPVPGGLVPEVTLTYSSGSVDGRTVSTNNQPSWVGEGWSLEFPYVERSYRSCTKDQQTIEDLCWFDGDNLSMMFGGSSSRLVKDDATGAYVMEADGRLRIERVTGGSNGVWQGERWKITTLDGTQYWFGTNPDSTQDVAVFGDDAGEPCFELHGPGLANSHCQMGYRWNLDTVVDVHGNTITYVWSDARHHYGRYNSSAMEEYTLWAYLDRIEYGANPTHGVTSSSAQVVFDRAWRCLVEPCSGPGSENNWFDVPWDLNCPEAWSSCPIKSPTFWAVDRLADVTTQVRNASGGWDDVDSYTLEHMFPSLPAGEDDSIALWMWAIDHVGHVGNTLSAPRTEFYGAHLPNRVNPPTGEPYLRRYRITGIDNHAGGQTVVAYNPADSCDPAVYHSNNVKRCFPQQFGGGWTWFHKYTVASVTEKDLTGGGLDEKWSYTYSAAGSSTAVLWRYAGDEHLAIGEQTWSIWAGYSNVKVTHGTTTGSQTVTESRYYRGFYGDISSWSQQHRWDTIADSQTAGLPDEKALAGRLREQTTYNGADIVSSTIHYPTITTTAVRDRNWDLGDWWAWHVDETKTRTRLRLTPTTWRWTETQTVYDSYGLPVDVTEYHDTSLSTDNVCTHTDYTRNDTLYLINFPSQVLSTNCDPAPADSDFVAGSQTFYDPVRGLPTRTMVLASVSGSTLTW